MIINVVKSNGVSEPLDYTKILRWGTWAAKDCPNVSLEDIITAAAPALSEGVSTADITMALCKTCEEFAKIEADQKEFHLVEQYFNIGRNLYIPTIIKKVNRTQSEHLFQADIYEEGYYISEDNLVPLPRFKLKAVLHAGIELGLYDPDLLDGSINDSVFEAADRLLDYSKMNLLYFGGLRQLEEKYLIKYNGQLFEDPQQHFMLIALTTLHADIRTYPNGKEDAFQLETLENYYIIQSHGEANNPTPFSVGLRTPFKQYDSCCLISIDDSDDSIAFGNLTGQKATVAGAGIGMTIGPIRSKDRPIRGGKMPHMGNLGYLGQISKTIKASNQVSRGGSATINLPMWTRDYYDLIMLKDISGIEGENRYRHLDYCWHYSKYMLHKLKTNGKILLHSPDEKLPDGRFAYNAFYHVNENGVYDDSAYVVWCEEELKNPDLVYINGQNSNVAKSGAKTYTHAYDLFSKFIEQCSSNGRLYTLNVDNTNTHSSFLEVIEMTNLCVEITQPTVSVEALYNSKEDKFEITRDNSEVSFCQLGGIALGKITKEDLPRITYWILRFQEAVFNISNYSRIPFSHKQKKRRNIGIGLVNLQHLLVKEVYSVYPQKDWIREAGRVSHEWMEAIQFHLLKNSMELAKLLGPCDLYDRTKYSKGILPIDTYTKSKLNGFPLLQDWGWLRKQIAIYGLRFSTNTALMPVESSSVTFGNINGIEFPKTPVMFKGNKKLMVAVMVPEIVKYGKHYVYAWNKYDIDVNQLYLSIASNLTKFLDQSISYNTYIDLSSGDKIPEEYLLNLIFIAPSEAGIKTTYYMNFNVDRTEEEDTPTSSEEMSQEDKEFFEQMKLLEQEGGGCASGSCSL